MMKQLYTVGNQRFYDESLSVSASTGVPYMKLGPNKITRYDGGFAFDSIAAANRFKRAQGRSDWAVYELDGDFEKDSYKSPFEGIHRITRSLEILRRVDP